MALTRTIPLQDYVFTRSDLVGLLKELSSHYRKPKEQFSSTWFALEMAQDATTTTSIDTPPKNFDALLNTQVERLRLAVHVRYAGRNLDVNLRHGGGFNDSSIRVYGDDEDWVNLTHGKVINILNTVQRQNRIIRGYPIWLWLALAISIGWVLDRGLSWYLVYIGEAKLVNWSWTLFAQHMFQSALLGVLPAGWLTEYLRKSFPTIELRLGPEHTWVEARRQRLLIAGIGVALIGPSGDILADVYRHLF